MCLRHNGIDARLKRMSRKSPKARALVAALDAQSISYGWTSKNHLKVMTTTGPVFVGLHDSNSDPRHWKNILQTLRARGVDVSTLR